MASGKVISEIESIPEFSVTTTALTPLKLDLVFPY